MNALQRNDRFYLPILLLAVSALYFSWALIIPFGAAPDETLRYDVVRFILQYHMLPVAGDPRLFYAAGQTYAAMPFFSYILSALLCILVKLTGIPIVPYLIARLVSVFSGVAAVYFVYRISEMLFQDALTKKFVPLFFAFIPQFAFICAYTNQDALMVMLSAATTFLWLKGLRENWSFQTVAWLGVVLGIMLLTYINGYVLILGTLFIVLISYRGKGSRAFACKLLLCLGIMAAIGGWFFIRSGILYHGDLLGLSTTDRIAEHLAMGKDKPSIRLISIIHLRGFADMLFDTIWPMETFRSFWATFGSMTLSLNPNYYLYILGLHVVAFVGLSAKLLEKAKGGWRALLRSPFTITLLLVAIGALILHAHYSLTSDFQPQGRYMYPGLVAIVLMMVMGFERALSGKIKRWFYLLVSLSFLLVQMLTIYQILFKYYFIQ
ncbi:MAG: glycosyltransferase family 39 protein [Ethanoligenens sp.]